MSLPTPFELSALSMLAKLVHRTSYPTELQIETAIDEAFRMWDEAGHRLGQIQASQDPSPPAPIGPFVFPCPICHKSMTRTASDSWCCYDCNTVWSLMEQGAEPEV